MIRSFDDGSIAHVEEGVNPVRDVAIIENELIAKDLQSASGWVKKKPKHIKTDQHTYDKFMPKVIKSL